MGCFFQLADGPTWEVISRDTDVKNFHLLKALIGHDVFWANVGWTETDWNLPPGHRHYLVMVEGPDLDWIEKQAERLGQPVDVLGMVNDYGYSHPLVRYHPWIEWHYQTREMLQTFAWGGKSDSPRLISALAARPAQNKIWAVIKVLQSFTQDQALVSLGPAVELKDVHHWQPTGRQILDDLTQIFVTEYLDRVYMSIDDFDPASQKVLGNHDYNSRPYRDAICNINNESWPYSFSQGNDKTLIYPGPFLTEKTMKCLLSETALINNGQFDVYRTLEGLGFKFDYGIDLEYDQLPGNLDRAEGLIHLLDKLSALSSAQCEDQTRDSRVFNRQHIVSGDFFDLCEKRNEHTMSRLLECMS